MKVQIGIPNPTAHPRDVQIAILNEDGKPLFYVGALDLAKALESTVWWSVLRHYERCDGCDAVLQPEDDYVSGEGCSLCPDCLSALDACNAVLDGQPGRLLEHVRR